MSTTHVSAVLYGISFPEDFDIVKTPNPLFGKCKFDPDTGKKVEEFIITKIDLEAEDMGKLQVIHTHEGVVMGLPCAETEYGCEKIPKLTEQQEKQVLSDINDCLSAVGLESVKEAGYLLVHYTY